MIHSTSVDAISISKAREFNYLTYQKKEILRVFDFHNLTHSSFRFRFSTELKTFSNELELW